MKSYFMYVQIPHIDVYVFGLVKLNEFLHLVLDFVIDIPLVFFDQVLVGVWSIFFVWLRVHSAFSASL